MICLVGDMDLNIPVTCPFPLDSVHKHQSVPCMSLRLQQKTVQVIPRTASQGVFGNGVGGSIVTCLGSTNNI